MNAKQRIRYIAEARLAFAREGLDPKKHFDHWRHAEVEYCLKETRSFKEFTDLQLTQCLVHFRALQEGLRHTPDEILEIARRRQTEGPLKAFRELWDVIEPGVLRKVLLERHSITDFAELASESTTERHKIFSTLKRLARDYPRKESAPCTTP